MCLGVSRRLRRGRHHYASRHRPEQHRSAASPLRRYVLNTIRHAYQVLRFKFSCAILRFRAAYSVSLVTVLISQYSLHFVPGCCCSIRRSRLFYSLPSLFFSVSHFARLSLSLFSFYPFTHRLTIHRSQRPVQYSFWINR